MRSSSLLDRFMSDASGQDLVEYGLVFGAVTVALLLIVPSLQTQIATVFARWGTQTNNLWVPVAPAP
jgi:Flp pilus assembly pilin Flp